MKNYFDIKDKVAVITGASSGLGLATTKALAETGKWHVIMACRDFLKAERAAKSAGISFTRNTGRNTSPPPCAPS